MLLCVAVVNNITSVRFSFAFFSVNERYGDITSISPVLALRLLLTCLSHDEQTRAGNEECIGAARK
jgi:hypothetical protein